jgi:hypothetical protein
MTGDEIYDSFELCGALALLFRASNLDTMIKYLYLPLSLDFNTKVFNSVIGLVVEISRLIPLLVLVATANESLVAGAEMRICTTYCLVF